MAIAQNLDDWSNQLKNLSSLRARWHQRIDRMVNTLASIKRWNHKLLLNTSIIILLTYFREVLSFLLELPMFQGPSDYNWCKVRVVWSLKVPQFFRTTNSIFARQTIFNMAIRRIELINIDKIIQLL